MAEAPPIYRFTSRLLPTCSIGSPQCFGHRRRSEYASAAAIHVRARALSTEPRDSVLASFGSSQSDRSLAYFRPPCRLAMSAQRFSLFLYLLHVVPLSTHLACSEVRAFH